MLAFAVALVTLGDGDLSQRLVPIGSAFRLSAAAKGAISKAIGNRAIVLLGELTHGDRESHAIKVEIVKLLHESKGFDVLIWESGLYDCWQMNGEIAGDKSLPDVARIGVFGHWSQGEETFPVFEYARAQSRHGKPLSMAGFDIQASGTAANSMFRDFVEWFDGCSELRQEDREAVEEAFTMAMGAGNSPEKMQRAQLAVYETAPRFLAAYRRNPKVIEKRWGADAGFRLRSIENAVDYGTMLRQWSLVQEKRAAFQDPYNLRERMNAANLEWLIRKAFAGRKVMVWAHNAHIFRGIPGRRAGLTGEPGPGELESTGRLLAKRFASQTYSIGFLAGGGAWSWLGNPPIGFRTPSRSSIEARIQATGSRCSFLDLRSLPANHPFRTPLPGTIDQQNPIEFEAVWPDGFDGLIFIDAMTPRKHRKGG